MAILITEPSVIPAAGSKPKIIREYAGRVRTKTPQASVARMSSPEGWAEPGQTPEFDEFTVVLAGILRVETRKDVLEARAGQGVLAPRGEWVRYSTPHAGGAEYVAVCVPAFSPDSVHRDPA
ncbi:MAG TPA: cupin [Elusimicrobiota bacterium]|nr:cupin [Elusimicrobiota bacterium]